MGRRDPEARVEWTADRLRSWVRAACGGESIIVLANREPLRHELAPDGRIDVCRSSGGVVTALEPLMHACNGVWVAHGSGTADRCTVDAHDGVAVPPANRSYRLRRVWLDPDEERGYYRGFSNEGLWPLCHRTPVAPIFRPADFDAYRAVNARFADAVREESTARPFVLVQDYHFALAPRMLRGRLPHATIVSFWHIPWPTPADFAACPWSRQLLHGLLGSTILGFQTDDDRRRFLDAVDALSIARVDRARHVVSTEHGETMVRVYPVSVEFPSSAPDDEPSTERCRVEIRQRLGLAPDALVGVGVDRLDYIKGLPEKFRAVERLLERHPELCGRFAFVQIAEPSRACLPAYRALRGELHAIAARINARFGREGYQPIALLDSRHEPPEVRRFYRGADLCYVSSLQDGMNLVAKEFVAARADGRGVLVLSERAGAARELTDALLVDPCAIDAAAAALYEALTMSEHEQRRRMRRLRSVVAGWTTFRWAAEMLGDAMRARNAPPVRTLWPARGQQALHA